MAKRTAVIDIGSNSARMAIYEKESRFAFHLLKEIKSRVRIGEGAYEDGGKLQPKAIERALEALNTFHKIASNARCGKIICVATSAVRDAPNSAALTSKIKKELGFNIRVINGDQEAYYGALGVINMLPFIEDAVTIDIGGGSTELGKIQNGKIVKTISLNIGTVRLKELFFDKKKPLLDAEKFICKELKNLDSDFSSKTVIGIGGTIRALGKLIMFKTSYPLSTVHGFEYTTKQQLELIRKIASSSVLNLKSLGVKKDRYDTIREGCAIFGAVLETLGAKRVITSGVGIREGVYLADILRGSHGRFAREFCLSLESLKARFVRDEKRVKFITKCADELFAELKPLHKLNDSFKTALLAAAKLESIGEKLGFYQEHLHASYFILNNLNYGFSHKDKALIAFIVKFYDKKITENDIYLYKELLPNITEIDWLIFIFTLSKLLYVNGNCEGVKFRLIEGALYVLCEKPTSLAKSAVKKMHKPNSFAVKFGD